MARKTRGHSPKHRWIKSHQQRPGVGFAMPDINRVVISGTLTHDPPLRKTKKGIPVTNFMLETQPDHSSKLYDEDPGQPCSISVVAWAKQAVQCNKFLKKGSIILIIGEMQSMPNLDSEKEFYPVQISAQWIQFLDKGIADSGIDSEVDNEMFAN